MVRAETIILRQQMRRLARMQRKGFKAVGNDLYMNTDDESTRHVYGRVYFNPTTGQVKIVEGET